MKITLFVALCGVSLLSSEVYAASDNEVKRGVYPYMAFIYYPDETVLDLTGTRFFRGGVLVRLNWLITAAVDTVNDNFHGGFPAKTMLARLGAISIDNKVTLNEDEDEQEREVIKVVRPLLHNSASWWTTDISLLKTLLPFNSTSAVTITMFNTERNFPDKNCLILVFSRSSNYNSSEEKSLIQLPVELLPPSRENCGDHFQEKTMTCGVDSEEFKKEDSNYCQGNSGGPLLCDGQVMGLQTYISNECRQPHLYQIIASWETFITCGMKEKCSDKECPNVCDVTDKDIAEVGGEFKAADVNVKPIGSFAEETATLIPPESGSAPVSEEVFVPTLTSVPQILVSATTAKLDVATEETYPTSIANETGESATSAFSENVPDSQSSQTGAPSTPVAPETTATRRATTLKTFSNDPSISSSVPSAEETSDEKSWPKERLWGNRRKYQEQVDEENEVQRSANVEAQYQKDKKKKLARGVAARNAGLVQTLFVNVLILMSVI